MGMTSADISDRFYGREVNRSDKYIILLIPYKSKDTQTDVSQNRTVGPAAEKKTYTINDVITAINRKTNAQVKEEIISTILPMGLDYEDHLEEMVDAMIHRPDLCKRMGVGGFTSLLDKRAYSNIGGVAYDRLVLACHYIDQMRRQNDSGYMKRAPVDVAQPRTIQ
jgi:hypothetical protein